MFLFYLSFKPSDESKMSILFDQVNFRRDTDATRNIMTLGLVICFTCLTLLWIFFVSAPSCQSTIIEPYEFSNFKERKSGIYKIAFAGYFYFSTKSNGINSRRYLPLEFKQFKHIHFKHPSDISRIRFKLNFGCGQFELTRSIENANLWNITGQFKAKDYITFNCIGQAKCTDYMSKQINVSSHDSLIAMSTKRIIEYDEICHFEDEKISCGEMWSLSGLNVQKLIIYMAN